TFKNSVTEPGEDDRERVGMRGAGVQEVDVQPVDLGAELRQRGEPRLDHPPVVLLGLLGPVTAQLPQAGERDPLRPVADRPVTRVRYAPGGAGGPACPGRPPEGRRAGRAAPRRRRPRLGPPSSAGAGSISPG